MQRKMVSKLDSSYKVWKVEKDGARDEVAFGTIY